MSQPVLVPLLNANEPEARLVEVHVSDGQRVEKGEILFTLETTKAAADVEAPASGFVRILAREGDTFSVGDRLAMIMATVEETIPPFDDEPSTSPKTATVIEEKSSSESASLRITKPARVLAEQLGMDLSVLPTDRLITETIIRQMTQSASPGSVAQSNSQYTNSHILIYGAGGHAKAVMEMAQAMGIFEIAGILDDKIPAGTSVLGIPVLGSREILPGLAGQGLRLAANGVGGILDINVRVKIFELLENNGFIFPALKHPRATVEPSATLNDGVQIFANAYVGSSALLHSKCMINTGAIVSHDCEIGAYTHIAPGAMLAGHVHVGERSLVGMGVTTAIGLKIGDGVRIGNGAIIYADVPDKAIVPAGKVWGG